MATGTARTILMALVLATIELAGSVILFRAQAPAFWFALAHVIVTAAAAVWLWRDTAFSGDLSRPILLVVMTAALGPLGSAGLIFTLLLTLWYARNTTPFEEWYRALFPDPEQDEQLLAWEKIILEQGDRSQSGVPAFNDVLAFGSQEQKQALLSLINRQFRPELGPVLKRALTDEANSIRVQAATAISRLENEFLGKTLSLKESIDANPACFDSLLLMARLCDDFAFSGILDGKRQVETRTAALEYYERYLLLRPDDQETRLTVARQLLRLGKFEQSLQYLDLCSSEVRNTERSLLWRLECLCALGLSDDARALATQHKDRLLSSETITLQAAGTVRLWAGSVEV